MLETVADLVAFLKRFHEPWMVDPALDMPVLDPAVIPAELPEGLATIYREFGGLVEIQKGAGNDWRAPFTMQDALMPLSCLKRVEGMIEFAYEIQGNWSARGPTGAPDPPVYSNAADV